jgi:hypothetical protein
MSEKTTHRAICDYLRLQYPKVLFNSDLSGSMRLTIGQARAFKNLRSNKGFPDLFIMESRNGFHGLFIEIKKEDTEIYCKRKTDVDGRPAMADDHVREQAEVIRILESKGYKACFAVGFSEAKQIIDTYLK